MSAPLKIDMHIHLYPDEATGLADKQYEIWEYGSWPGVRFSDDAGTVPQFQQAVVVSGISKGVLLIYFMGLLKRREALARLQSPASPDQIAALVTELIAKLESGNRWGCEVAKANPSLTTFVTVDINLQSPEQAASHLRHMVEAHGARGLKLHGSMQGFSMADEKLWPTYSVCEQFDVPILGHAGPDREQMGYAEPRVFEPMLAAFPKLRVVLAHLGGAACRQSPGVAERHPNAFFDCSEIIHWTGSPNGPTENELALLIRQIGTDRVMMGSDYPWYDLDHTVDRVMQLPLLSAAEKEAIIGGNAQRILRL